MTSYNAVNGIYPSESAPLLTELLRKEWGFEGFVMTDWGAVDYTADPVRSLSAGTDLLTPGIKSCFAASFAPQNGAKFPKAHCRRV